MPFQEIGVVFSPLNGISSLSVLTLQILVTPHGDITKFSGNDIPDHDLLLAGFLVRLSLGRGLRKVLRILGDSVFEIQKILISRPKAFLPKM